MKDWPAPTTKKGVRSFLGLSGYYRKFIKNYAQVAAPLHALSGLEIAFKWEDEQQTSFDTLKSELIKAPILGYPKKEGLYILDTDASNCGIGAVLSQQQDGIERVLSYGSRVLSPAERNYCVTRRELLAVVDFMEKYRHYLYGKKFLVRTDHAALRWLLQKKNPEGQVARWLDKLASFDYDIEHRAGKLHGNADALSRIPCPFPCAQCGREHEDPAPTKRRPRAASSHPL